MKTLISTLVLFIFLFTSLVKADAMKDFSSTSFLSNQSADRYVIITPNLDPGFIKVSPENIPLPYFVGYLQDKGKKVPKGYMGKVTGSWGECRLVLMYNSNRRIECSKNDNDYFGEDFYFYCGFTGDLGWEPINTWKRTIKEKGLKGYMSFGDCRGPVLKSEIDQVTGDYSVKSVWRSFYIFEAYVTREKEEIFEIEKEFKKAATLLASSSTSDIDEISSYCGRAGMDFSYMIDSHCINNYVTIKTKELARKAEEEKKKTVASGEDSSNKKRKEELKKLEEEKKKKEIAEAKKREEERKKAEAEKKRQEEIAKLEAQKELEERNKPERASSGSGFLVSSSGHIVTNSHVVNQCDETKIFLENDVYMAKTINENSIYDLALLKIDKSTPQYAKFSAKDGQLGEEILVFGYPFGKHLSSYIKVTKGIVSSLTGLENDLSLLQIDAAIQPGNSGGPIYNLKGEVIGVTVSSIDKAVFFKEFELIPENINFGIKNSIAKIFLEANNLDFEPSSNTTKLESQQVAQIGNENTVYVECWMPVAKMRKLRGSNNLVDFNLN